MVREKYNSAEKVDAGSFGVRLVGYLVFYVLLSFTILLLIFLAGKNVPIGATSSFKIIITHVFLWGGSIIPFILWERNIRKFRRKNGLSIYKDVREEMEQLEFNKEYAKEAKAREAYEASKK